MKIKFLDLGMQPIANNFLLPSEIKDEFKFHLTVTFDTNTKLVSLGEFVPPARMFNDTYTYHSSGSNTMTNHFRDTAKILKTKFNPETVLEIGSNDGVFIKNFDSNSVVAVEPCGNFANITNALGYKTLEEFWTLPVAKQIVKENGSRDLIYAANCMCHIQNLSEAFSAIETCLSDNGVFVFEDPSLLQMLDRGSYDQIYDEHAHVFSITALKHLLANNGLQVFNVEKLSVHGGSNRVYACKTGTRDIDASVRNSLSEEDAVGIYNVDTYHNFAKRVEQSKHQLLCLLLELKRRNFKIISYGATSKSTTVFNYCGIDDSLIDYIIDTTPSKQGKLSPGMHIPVVCREGNLSRVDYAFLGAWNYEEEICNKENDFLKTGRFITHVPYVRLI